MNIRLFSPLVLQAELTSDIKMTHPEPEPDFSFGINSFRSTSSPLYLSFELANVCHSISAIFVNDPTGIYGTSAMVWDRFRANGARHRAMVVVDAPVVKGVWTLYRARPAESVIVVDRGESPQKMSFMVSFGDPNLKCGGCSSFFDHPPYICISTIFDIT